MQEVSEQLDQEKNFIEISLLAISIMSGGVALMGATKYGVRSAESVIPTAMSIFGPGTIAIKSLISRQQG